MPVAHILAGPNGAGKSTFVRRVLQPITHLPFVNADEIAAERWPDSVVEHSYEAAQIAAAQRKEFIERKTSFITETVFSHRSKLDLIRYAQSGGYLVYLHVILVPKVVSVGRVPERVRRGGHHVPKEKIEARYDRLWPLVVEACTAADRARFYDNSSASDPFRLVANYESGQAVSTNWPMWTPSPLQT